MSPNCVLNELMNKKVNVHIRQAFELIENSNCCLEDEISSNTLITVLNHLIYGLLIGFLSELRWERSEGKRLIALSEKEAKVEKSPGMTEETNERYLCILLEGIFIHVLLAPKKENQNREE
ncbi:CLUMA_CG018715, isoform A [Clunio marinus]|uniref:CLUMA_CG018715, isoform A n=1 Tax=Clunio marinus TaxID=568069 RepID=A0A1J1IZI3_9DIPT|nr:CLUMA_CG018715, isoform A [Clunio marinus]